MLNKSTYRVVEDVDPYRSLRIKLTDKSKFERFYNQIKLFHPLCREIAAQAKGFCYFAVLKRGLKRNRSG